MKLSRRRALSSLGAALALPAFACLHRDAASGQARSSVAGERSEHELLAAVRTGRIDEVRRLLAQDAAGKALKIGERAPADLLVQTSGGEQPLSRFFTEKLLVLTWFRGNW